MAPDDSQDSVSALIAVIATFEGESCWSVTSGGAAGSNVKLEFGNRIPRTTPLQNRQLTHEQRQFEGARDVFIECAWRLEEQGRILTGSGDDLSAQGSSEAGIQRLVGRIVTKARISTGVPDLSLTFSEGLALHIFCDHSALGSDADNYSLRVGHSYIVVNAAGDVVQDTRRAD